MVEKELPIFRMPRIDFVEEEEHGIEMTDDFESDLHDMDKNEQEENEESGEEDDDHDIDQQMGDVEGEQEKLDERLWGDSEGEEDNEVKGT